MVLWRASSSPGCFVRSLASETAMSKALELVAETEREAERRGLGLENLKAAMRLC